MATSTITQIEMQPIRRVVHPTTTTTTTDTTNIIQESLITDSEVPEGGYGWYVVFACAFLNFWGIGICYGWGIFQAALVKQGRRLLTVYACVCRLAHNRYPKANTNREAQSLVSFFKQLEEKVL
jgi:hypothetical protein